MLIDEIRGVLEAKASALVRRSAADLAALLHHSFIYVTAGGRTLTKADYIDVSCLSGKVTYRSQKISDLEVRQFEGFTVATMALEDELTLDGREITETFSAICVFTRPDGRWQWAAGQAMRPAAP
jgi:hypothetical protein